ncbi:MAG: thioesterase, partial [Aestuariivirgaceae bacterium]
MVNLSWQADEVMEFLHAEFPQAFAHGRSYTIKDLQPGKARIAFTAGNDQLRPGGTVSGPALMEL